MSRAFTSRVLGGKWKARIVWALVREEPQRYSALRRACPPVSDRSLTMELRELEEWGLISRREYPVIPPKTEYSLTELGNTLRSVMAAMAEWGLGHRSSISIAPGLRTTPPNQTPQVGM
jgi:DNA-binding HxlR family transcriptional regulator